MGEDGKEGVEPGHVMGADVQEDEEALVIGRVSAVGAEEAAHLLHGD